MDSVDFTISGKHYRLTREQVTQRVRGSKPGQIQTHAVEIRGVMFPIKEALAISIGADVLDFNTNQARRIFKKLGFTVERR